MLFVLSQIIRGVYNTRLVSYYPEGELPASVNTLADEDLPLFTPRNQILYSNPVNNKNDNPRIFLKSILKPLKGLEAVFEYTVITAVYFQQIFVEIIVVDAEESSTDSILTI
mgnify:CR=1 FL=1